MDEVGNIPACARVRSRNF